MSAPVRASFWNLPIAELTAHLNAAVLEGAGAVVPFVRPSTPKTAVALSTARRRLTFKGFNDFMPAFRLSRELAKAKCGVNWWMDPNESLWARVPASWVAWKGSARSGTSPRDLHFPMGQFWPGGELPIGPEYAAPVSVAQFAAPPPRRKVVIEAPEWEWLADAAD